MHQCTMGVDANLATEMTSITDAISAFTFACRRPVPMPLQPALKQPPRIGMPSIRLFMSYEKFRFNFKHVGRLQNHRLISCLHALAVLSTPSARVLGKLSRQTRPGAIPRNVFLDRVYRPAVAGLGIRRHQLVALPIRRTPYILFMTWGVDRPRANGIPQPRPNVLSDECNTEILDQGVMILVIRASYSSREGIAPRVLGSLSPRGRGGHRSPAGYISCGEGNPG